MASLLGKSLALLLAWFLLAVPYSQSQLPASINAQAVPSCPHCQHTCNGDRSVSYVVDTTGSMRNDIGQVCQRTMEMARTLQQITAIQRAVLVPFGDPDIGPPKFFTSLDQLASAACDLRPRGGVDCPERVLSGLLMGLESSCPKSTVYVFTDAIAKDVDLLGKVLSVIQEKQIKVVFVLSGSCGAAGTPYFDSIAALSGGQLFRTTKDDVGDILNFAQSSINNEPQVSLLWENSAPPFWTSDFVVEAHMTSVQVVVSCDNKSPTVELYQPGRLEPITYESKLPSISWSELPQSVLIALDATAMIALGVWQVHVLAESQCRVSVTAHGVPEVTSSFAKITEVDEHGEVVSVTNPFEGSNFVLVDSPNSHIIQYVEFIGGDGSRFATSSPTEGGISASSMGSETILGPAVVPGESFFVRYRGLQNVTDSEGHTEAKPFKRYSSSALIPQPNPSMKGAGANLRAAHCQQVKLKCPKRKRPGTNSDQDTVIPVAWFKNSEPYVPSSSYNVSIKDTAEKSTLTFKQFRSKHAGVYSCYLATSTGLTLAAEYNVTAEETTARPCPAANATNGDDGLSLPTPSVWRPQPATVSCLMLNCLAAEQDNEHGSVRWMNTLSAHHYDRNSIHRHYRVLSNGSLRICDPQRQHLGWYMCSTPHYPRPSAVKVTAADIDMLHASSPDSTQASGEDYEELIRIMEGERDAAKQAAKVAEARVAELQNSLVNSQRLLHNSEADRLHAVQSHQTCRTRLHRIRTALGLPSQINKK